MREVPVGVGPGVGGVAAAVDVAEVAEVAGSGEDVYDAAGS